MKTVAGFLTATLLFVAELSASVVSDVMSLTMTKKAGEVQSTVVPPGKKAECMGGRLLVSNDMLRPPAADLIIGRDLDDPSVETRSEKFDMGALPGTGSTPDPYRFGTNDHDLVSLSNGDVLYITGAFSRRQVTPKPDWFDGTYRGDFGPGARYVILVFRSTDCGRKFTYLSQFDPATNPQTAFCALPQKLNGEPAVPEAKFDMGGSDGQFARVANDDTVYLTFGCVGRERDATSSEFALSEKRIQATLVLAAPKGAKWSYVGPMQRRGWRTDVIPGAKSLTFAFPGELATASLERWPVRYAPVSPGAEPGWTGFGSGKVRLGRLCTNMWFETVGGRIPGTSDAFMLIPTSDAEKGHGYRLFFHNRNEKRFWEGEWILPVKASKENFVLHPTVIDGGRGPVLVYWYDVDAETKKVVLRGRFIEGRNDHSGDFDVSRQGGKRRLFELAEDPDPAIKKCGAGAYWYGDYFTAGMYAITPKITNAEGGGSKFIYYPAWVEPGATVSYARVEYRKQKFEIAKGDRWTLERTGSSIAKRNAEEALVERYHETKPKPIKLRPR
jgi:hypothetical protein